MIDWTRLTPAVDRAAGIAVSNFPAHHDVSDVKQELWVWIMDKKPFILEALKKEKGEQTLISLMIKVAQSYLKKEDAATYGYEEGDQYFYSVDEIKSILAVVFQYENWQTFSTSYDDMPKAKGDPSHTGDSLASFADVKSAVDHLSDEQYNILIWRYKYSYTFTKIGEEMGFTKQAAQERHNRAVTAIQKYLGQRPLGDLRNPPKVPSRPSNIGSAQALTEKNYEG